MNDDAYQLLAAAVCFCLAYGAVMLAFGRREARDRKEGKRHV